jgi:hypothetical protein
MAEYLPAPTFNLQYTTPLTDIGKGYAEGITKAGESLGSAITGVMGGVNPKTGEVTEGILGQQRKVDDTLAAMYQSGMLKKEQYDAVAGKSMGAKQQMVGLFASDWVNQQAQDRALALQKGQAANTIGVEHAKLLDTINMMKNQGVVGNKVIWRPGQNVTQGTQNVTQGTQNAVVAPTTNLATPGADQGAFSAAGHIPFQPGTQRVQVKDKSGNLVWALKTPDNRYFRVN